MPQTIPDLYIRLDSQTYYQWRVDPTGYIRLDALKSGRKCTPGKTVECGNVCRKPENCKKKGSESAPAQAEASAPAAEKKANAARSEANAARSGAAKQAKPKPQTETQAKGIVKPLETAKLPVVPPAATKKPRAKKAGPSAIEGGEAVPVKEKKGRSKSSKAQSKEGAKNQPGEADKTSSIVDKKNFSKHYKQWNDGIENVKQLAKIATIDKGIAEALKDGDEGMAEILRFQKKSLEKNLTKKASVSSDVIESANLIFKDLQSSIDSGDTPGGVLGSDGKMKAAYTYKKSKDGKSIEVPLLVSSPDAFLEGEKQKGGGSQAIKDLVQISLDQGLNGRITLYSLPTAESFYRKLGFEGEDGYMSLSPEAAKRLLAGK